MVDRTEKLNAELQKNIYEILSKRVKNPHLTEMFTITKVSCDKELTYAKVFVSIFSTDEARSKATFDAILSSAGFVRQCLAKMMRIRAIPQIAFEMDNTMDYGDKIDKILNEIKQNDNNN